jgi:hypothetical protein
MKHYNKSYGTPLFSRVGAELISAGDIVTIVGARKLAPYAMDLVVHSLWRVDKSLIVGGRRPEVVSKELFSRGGGA